MDLLAQIEYGPSYDFLIWVLVWVVVWGLIGGLVGQSNGFGGGSGALLGGLLGFIGVILVAVMGSTKKGQVPEGGAAAGGQLYRRCPFCFQGIHPQASVCPYCQRESEPWRLHEGRWWRHGSEGNDEYWDAQTRRWVLWDVPTS